MYMKQKIEHPYRVDPEVSDADRERYLSVVSIDLSPEQEEMILSPSMVRPWQREVLAVHWHPEFIPMELAMRRVRAMFPNQREELIIPTQHNEILYLGGYAGVEADCYASGFKRKVQLLLHFKAENLEGGRGEKLKSMLAHTFKYRSSQLFEFLDALIADNMEQRRQKAAAQTGADENLVDFCRQAAEKLRRLLQEEWDRTPPSMIKNKLVPSYFELLRRDHPNWLIDRAQVYLKAVKKIVKANFSLMYFYRASEVIEEARALGAGVVIPHPEQFWPILLADYDVDGYEVWNPQSSEYTEFLIQSLNRQNKARAGSGRPLLVFMGDDCHMSEKIKPPQSQDPAKAAREVGYQPPWEDMAVRKSLITSNVSRSGVIKEYAARLG